MQNSSHNLFYTLTMLVLSLASVLALAAFSFSDITSEQRALLGWFDLLLCALFFCDFLFCLYRAEDRKRYFITWGWLDLISSIPIVGPFRLARFARIARVLRLLRGLRAARVFAEFALAKRKKNAFMAVGLLSLLMLVSSGLAVLHVETDPASNIKTAEDALWWSITTMTTVGYGDRYPVTTEGRLIASVLMVFGLAMFGAFSGFMAAWLVGNKEDETQSEKTRENSQLIDEIRALRQDVAKISINAEKSEQTNL